MAIEDYFDHWDYNDYGYLIDAILYKPKISSTHWNSAGGTIKISDMSNAHLINCVKMLQSQNKQSHPCYNTMILTLEQRNIKFNQKLIS